ncbi:MAG: hypothetical protein LBK47_04085 [Prevotellaceae bacterium]|jgi:outer membrane lipoprotein SlyB|nr:hypothetical protein [Prevotellaceae bacterium]
MKLYVKTESGEKVYLNISAATRAELSQKIGSNHFTIRGVLYSVNDVKAEKDRNTTTGAVIGGALGILGGPLGIAIGSGLGALVGRAISGEDSEVDRFNYS